MTTKSSIFGLIKSPGLLMSLIRNVSLFFSLIFVALTLLIGCNSDDEKKVRRGLLSNNLCFTTQGGDIFNQVVAQQPWKIVIPDRAQPWIWVKPSSGSGDNDTTNVIISVLVNNNPLSRYTPIMVIIEIGRAHV